MAPPRKLKSRELRRWRSVVTLRKLRPGAWLAVSASLRAWMPYSLVVRNGARDATIDRIWVAGEKVVRVLLRESLPASVFAWERKIKATFPEPRIVWAAGARLRIDTTGYVEEIAVLCEWFA